MSEASHGFRVLFPLRCVLRAALIGMLCAAFFPVNGFSESARDIVSRANDLIHGKSSTSTAVITVIKPDWSRSMTTKLWMLEPDYALILITEPARDKGNVF